MRDSLHSLLREWEVRPVSNPNFRAAVWGRIAAHKQRLSFRIWRRTDELLGQPAWAALVVVALLLAGGLSGTAWRQHQVEEERAAGLVAYIVSVNPVVRATSDHHR